jgi:FkbM family methyltransferase
MGIYDSGLTLARRILGDGDGVLGRLRSRLGFAHEPVMRVGPGKGLRFTAGPSNPAYSSGDNELPVQEAIAANLKPGDVFFDVGANVGFFSMIAARLVGPSGRVIAFEPVPSNVAVIRENARLNGFQHVQIVEQAVYRESGRSELALADYAGGAMLAAIGRPPDDSGRTLQVATTSLDDAVFGAGLPAPRLIKIDVEGAELDVLIGMERLLKEVRPIVLFEIDDEQQAALDEKMVKCREFLEQRGYRVDRLPDSYIGAAWKVAHAVATHA